MARLLLTCYQLMKSFRPANENLRLYGLILIASRLKLALIGHRVSVLLMQYVM